MRYPVRPLSAFFFVALFHASLFAQFQVPSPDDLKMTSYPTAPGAAAVFLNVEEITNDPLHFYTFYARIKVLQEEGRELSAVEIPLAVGDSGITSYKPRNIGQDWITEPDQKRAGAASAAKDTFKIQDVKARTIHPDGTVVPLTVAPENLLFVRSPDGHSDHATFNLPGVEVGSILEYRYTVHYDENHFSTPFWNIQRPYPIRRAHYVFTPFNDFLNGDQSMTSKYLLDAHGKVVNTIIAWPVLPAGASVRTDPNGTFTLDLTDVPPIPNEEWMPPLRSFIYHVNFYYKNAFSGAEFWAAEEKRWSKDVDRFVEPTAQIRQDVADLVAQSDSDLIKAKKLYKAVQALNNTDFSGAGTKPSNPQPAQRSEEVWFRKSGSSQEIALLYISLLRAAGVAAYDMRIVDRDQGVFSTGYLSFDQFDSDVVILDLDGKDTFLDPGQKLCSFETVHWKHSGASGIRQTATGVAVATTPFLAYTANTLVRSGDIDFENQNKYTGLFRFIMTGQDALYWRQQALVSSKEDVRKSFDEWLASMTPEGAQAHFDHFLGIDNPDLNLVAVVNVEGSIRAFSGRLALPASFFEAHSLKPFVNSSQRRQSIDVHYGRRVTDEIAYHLPTGYAVQNKPDSVNLSLEHVAAFAANASVESGTLTILRALDCKFTLAGVSEYPAIRGFFQKIAEADKKEIVVVSTASAAN